MVKKLQNVDRLVLQAICASPEGTLFGAKKLQKLLFTAHHPKQFGLSPPRALRSFRFIVYKRGPFSEAIYASIDRLVDNSLIEVETKDISRRAAEPVSPDASDEDLPAMRVTVYRARPGAKAELVGADSADLQLVRSAVKTWGWLTSEQIEELVLIRTGLTPALKSRFAGFEWGDFMKQAASELPKDRPEPPEAYWRAQQQFFKERSTLLRDRGEGEFAAYVDQKRVAIANDEVEAYKATLAGKGRPPDYIGFISKSGRARSDAIWSA